VSESFPRSAPLTCCRSERLCRRVFLPPVPTAEDELLFMPFLLGGPDRDCREVFNTLGLPAGGPIERRLLVLSRDLTLESEVLAVVVVGVVVRGVEAAELAEDANGFVGDLVGDCST
jgi:hypothetical protein